MLTKIFATAFVALFMSTFAMAQAEQNVAGPNGGQVFTHGMTKYYVELQNNGAKGQAEFYVIDTKMKNTKLTKSAATAEIIVDYNGVRPAEQIQVTIKDGNKFSVQIPDKDKVNFYAITTNFNGEIMHARFIVNPDIKQ